MSIILNWIPNIDANVISQRAYWRQRSVGGAFNTTLFLPGNDLPTSATTTTHANPLLNRVYEYRIANVCTSGGPTFNGNGIQEGIELFCYSPNGLPPTSNSITVGENPVSVMSPDAIKIKYTLYDSSGTTLLQGPITIPVVADAVTHTFTGLTPNTAYVVRMHLVFLVNGVEIDTSLSSVCITGTIFTTLP